MRCVPRIEPRLSICLALALTVGVGVPEIVRAHPPTVLNQGASAGIADEVRDLRRRIAEAIKAKDTAALRRMYAETFQHIHPSVETDGREGYIAAAVAGAAVIENTEATDVVVRVYAGGWAAVVSGTALFKAKDDSKAYAVRWMQVFARDDAALVLVASQATRTPEIKAP